MKTVSVLLVSCALAVVPAQYGGAQTAGSTRLGVAVEELKVVAVGWSVKKQILGKTVYNENNQKVGRIDDLIVRDGRAHSAARRGQGHLHIYPRAAVISPRQFAIVNQSQIDNVDRNFRVITLAQLIPNIFLGNLAIFRSVRGCCWLRFALF